jgi:Cu-processing system permease protein
VLAFATCFGYGAAVAALLATGGNMDREGLAAFVAMIGASVLLGAVFIAIGYWVSAVVRDRGTAAGISIGLWLLLVLVYDMALLGLLVLDGGQNMSGTVLNTLLLLNPTDIYRLLNLTSFANVSVFSGMAGLAGSATLSVRVLVAALVLWTLIPLIAASLSFSRREL